MRHIAARAAEAAGTALFVTVLTFLAFNVIPGDPARLILGVEATEERVEALREELGLNESLPRQYFNWLSGMAHGDFGMSIKHRRPAAELIGQRLGATAGLAAMSLAFSFAIAIPLAIMSARKKRKIADALTQAGTSLALSIPGFYLGMALILVFGLKLKLFQPYGYVSYKTDVAGFLKYMAWPALALALPGAAVLLKHLRASIFEELKKPYVATAYSKGASEKQALRDHVLRNAFLPNISLVGMMAASAFGGSVIMEQVFSVPGIGGLLASSISARDFPVAQTLVTLVSVIVIAANSLADTAMRLLDPRMPAGARKRG
jgi:peptide/nickel transport system permease protein